MISFGTSSGSEYWDIRGLSTDEKPVKNVPNGSSFTEMDTQKVFFFNAETETWIG